MALSFTPKQLAAAGYVANAVAASLFSAPAGVTGLWIKQATVTNIDTTARTLTLYLVPNGGAAGASNTIISGKSIGAGETVALFELLNMVIPPGAAIFGLSSTANTLVFTASGLSF